MRNFRKVMSGRKQSFFEQVMHNRPVNGFCNLIRAALDNASRDSVKFICAIF